MDHVKPDMLSQYNAKTIKELLKLLEEVRKDKKIFTAKDKVRFDRLDALNEKFESYTEKIKELEKNEEKTHKLIESFDNNTQERISKVFKSFSTYFQQCFSKITGGGKSELKLLKDNKATKNKRASKDASDLWFRTELYHQF